MKSRAKIGNRAAYPIWLAHVMEDAPSRRGLYIFSWREDADYAVEKSVHIIHDTDLDIARTLPKIIAGIGHGPNDGYTLDYLVVFWIGMAVLSDLCALSGWPAEKVVAF